MSTKLHYIIKRSCSHFVPKKKFVYVSLSHNVYTNLALEDWLFRNTNCTDQHLLLMWQNEPCVLVGTFQNPWLETNPSVLSKIGNGVSLARRASGGGTVYHDQGNLNLTFFTTVKSYNRRRNLEFIQDVLLKYYNIRVDITAKSDLLLDGAKVSGSAAKLGLKNAYHHCSLLVDVDKSVLKTALESSIFEIKTNATKSTGSDIANLRDKSPWLTVEGLINSFREEYLSSQDGFELVIPHEIFYEGIDDLKNKFSSWNWLYGRSPMFSVVLNDNFGKIKLIVEKGIITQIIGKTDKQVIEKVIGQKFDQTILFDSRSSKK